jgi:hypothetical protein
MTNIIEELKQREEAAKAEARENYWALVEAMAKGNPPAISADECEAVLAAAGRTSKDLEADLARVRGVIEAEEDVDSYPEDADEQVQKARTEHGELLRKQKLIRDVELPRAERESEARVFHAESQAHYRHEALKDLAAAKAALEEARTGRAPKPKTESAPEAPTRMGMIISGPHNNGWEPPSDYDYDHHFNGDGTDYWVHRRTGERVYRPKKTG